jgi:hypothetical protein
MKIVNLSASSPPLRVEKSGHFASQYIRKLDLVGPFGLEMDAAFGGRDGVFGARK